MRPLALRLWTIRLVTALSSTLLLASLSSPLLAHCDTLDGPVVEAARAAVEKGDVTPVLKWVLPEHEAAVRSAFERATAARGQGPAARELADLWLFETVVRLHRLGEGFPYTGLEPAGTPIEPIILAADEALDSGSVEELVSHLAEAIATGVRTRFRAAHDAKAHAAGSVEAGRHYVAAYVELTHYVEAIDALASGHTSSHGGETGPAHRHGE